MSLRDRFLVSFVFSALALLVGCGTSANIATAPPTGAFSNSSLRGTYVFSFSGTDITLITNNIENIETFFAVAGTLTANGSGGFSGTIDINDPALGTALGTSNVLTGLVVATGSYSIAADGRGSGTIAVTINGRIVRFGLDFVLITSSQGLITRFDGNGTGSGTIDLQTSGVAQSALQGSYAFGLGGVDSVGNPLSTVGSFTLDSVGNVIAGSQDFNDNRNSTNLQALPLQSPSTVLLGSPSGRAKLTTAAAGFGTLSFDAWVIDSTHLKFIETDAVAALAGDAFVSTGQTSFPSGQLVFTMMGLDISGYPLAVGGLLTSNGSILITGGLEDANDAGVVVQAPSINGSFSPSSGRTQLTLNGIYNGDVVNNTLVTGDYTFAAYPYNGGIVLLEIDNAGITGGTAYVQSATSVAASQGYGLNLTGANFYGEVDLIAEFTATSGNLTGLYDVNNLGTLASDLSLGTGSYSVNSSNGRGVASFPGLQTSSYTVIPALDVTFYVLNTSAVVFIETDVDQVAAGIFQLQSASSVSPAVLPHFALMQPRPSPHMSRGRQK